MKLLRAIAGVGFVLPSALSVLSVTAGAQSTALAMRTEPRYSPMFSATSGVGRIDGGAFTYRARKFLLDLTLGAQHSRSAHISHFAAINAGAMAFQGGRDVSVLCRPNPDNTRSCTPVPEAPDVAYGSLLLGAQYRARMATVAASLGPGVFKLGNDVLDPGSAGSTKYGTVFRTDLWFRVARRLDLGVSATARGIPAYRGSRIAANSVSSGIRFVR